MDTVLRYNSDGSVTLIDEMGNERYTTDNIFKLLCWAYAKQCVIVQVVYA